ncbi:MAG TPA: hypothetical protein VFP61_03915, partial [Acidimicrobiales bacterium]|nr:hypothetical protein [Acidimicrobiales bacterium]
TGPAGVRRGGHLLPASAGDRRFTRTIAPAAPWVFGSAGVAYAVLPQALAPQVGGSALLFATLLTVVTLGAGVLVQPQVRRFDRADRPVALRRAMGLVVAGILLAAAAVATARPALAVVAAAVLGVGYGIGLVAGLLEVQRVAPPGELASLTGVFGALTYVGFLFPTALALAAGLAGTATELLVLAAVAACCGAGLVRRRPAATLGLPSPGADR